MKYRFVSLAALSLFGGYWASRAFAAARNLAPLITTTVQYRQLDNVDLNLLSLDIYHSADLESSSDSLKPVVIYVHGGSWNKGDKALNMANKVALFNREGYVLVSVNYRLSPNPYAPNNPNRIKYPIHNQDIAQAIKWVVDNIDQYGGDANKIALLGHSAGAHLVALTGTNERFLNEVGVELSAIKAIAAIDSQGYDVQRQVQAKNPRYLNAFGTDTAANQEASPLYNLEKGKDYPKFLIGRRSRIGQFNIADDFVQNLRKVGAEVTMVNGAIYSHAEINAAIGKSGETLLTPALVAFLRDAFK